MKDTVTLTVRSGNGGSGVIRWRPPKNGPIGGDGGDGGGVYARAVRDVFALGAYKEGEELCAENGGVGGSEEKRGKNGAGCCF